MGRRVVPPLGVAVALCLALASASSRASAQAAAPTESKAPEAAPAGPSPWLVDLNLGAPAFQDYVRLMGDGALGYRTARFGVVTTGGVNYYDLQTTAILTDNLHAWGGVEGYYLTGVPESKLRVRVRASGGVDYYDSTTIEAQTTRGSSFQFGDYDSLLIRALVDVGAVWRVNERWTLDGHLGGGLQHESYDTTSLDASGVQFVSPTSLSARGTGSLGAKWRFWPQRLRARLYGNASIFQLTRETVSFSASSTGQTQEGLSSTAETQLEARARGSLDLEAFSLAGFLPSVWLGVDYVSSSGASTTIPSLGLGIVRMD